MSVIIETSIGDITVDLYTDERPRCCMNFLKLCKMKYYNFSLFHSVQKDLVAQTGDPTATGRGGESIFGFLYGEQARFFEMEIAPRILHNKKGLFSMVNNGSGMHGSQFFITLADSVDYLNNKHTVFGEVAEGMDIVDKLNNAFCDEGNRPHQDIRIYHTIILDDPYDDPDGLVIPDKSPSPTQEMLDSDRIPCDADIDDEQGMTEEQLNEMAADREAKANTQILEMVGDLPDQDLAPPENVLFVCKLNPVTTSDDLEIIFSRFGTVVSCDVIKDQKTGESLQYAFVEFERQQDCEMAYFKMDNVLIDDRRIHVDFSQSVSKLKWKGKGKGVEIMKDGDAPKYVLKNQQRKSDGYDLVYDHDDLDDEDASNKDKSRKKHKNSKKEDFHESSKNSHRGNDRDRGNNKKVDKDRADDRKRGRYDQRDNERMEDGRRDKYNDRDRERNTERRNIHDERDRGRRDKFDERDRERRDKFDERDRERRDRYDERDRERRDRCNERDKYDDRDRERRDGERNKDRRERSKERDHKRTHNDEEDIAKRKKKESYIDTKRNYSDDDLDEDSERYRPGKETSSKSKTEVVGGRYKSKAKKSSRKESYSDGDDDEKHKKIKNKHKNKKHKSEKKRKHYSDSSDSSNERSSEDESDSRRRRKQRSESDSDEEFSRRKEKKKKRRA